jgi:tol-pal system protein YbgF
MIISRLQHASSLRVGHAVKNAALAVAVISVSGACFFATKSDFDQLQQDVVGTRASSNAADSVQRAYLIEVTRTVRTLSDSVNALSRRVNAMKTATESDLASMKEDIQQLQDLSGQSEQRLRDMRAAIEDKSTSPPPTGTSGDTSAAADQPTAGGPGPAQLLQAGRDQLLKGGNTAARAAFAELIQKYPKSDLVPEAMFYTAQAYAAERNNEASDAEYASLIQKYPSSPRVPTAMYKRALSLQSQKKTAEAKRIFQDIIKRYPRSDEAALADERLQSIK